MVSSSNGLLFFFFFYLSAWIDGAMAETFNFSSLGHTPECVSGQRTNCLVFQNDAYYFPSNHSIEITKDQHVASLLTNSIGRAVYSEPILLWDSASGVVTDFVTHFSFIIGDGNRTNYGDGLAFFLSSFPSVIPNNSSDGLLGLFNDSSPPNATKQMVAVEFDSFQNPWDPSGNHVGINVNSIVSVATVNWSSIINDGRLANAWVSYNSSTKNLSVFLTYADNPVFGGNSSLSYIVDLKDILPENVMIGFSASSSSSKELHTLISWEFSSTLVIKKKSRVGLLVGVLVGTAVLVAGVLGVIWIVIWRRSGIKEDDLFYDESIDEEFQKGTGPKRFPYSELVSATKNFAEEGKLGEGGFGSVYKGYLTDLRIEVAIKKVSGRSKQGKKEYVSEVKIISRLRHRNLVQLVGWCHDRGEFMLIYEFMPNGSLDKHLGRDAKLLPWPVRHRIALGLASALLYLHEEWEQCVLHRDVKPSNIMLDSDFNARLGDFGLARLIDHDGGLQTTVIAGTMGYMAPESMTTGKASRESDVYSFGIVLLEIASGRRPVERQETPDKVSLLAWVWELYGTNRLLEAADERLTVFDEEQMETLMVVGLWCSHPDYKLRPSIKKVISTLKLEAPLPELPSQMPVATFLTPSMGRDSYTNSSSVPSGSNMMSIPNSNYATYSTTPSVTQTSYPTTSLVGR